MTADPEVVELRSTAGFEETLARLEDALAKRPVEVFARIDHQANAREVGMSMPPATVVVFGAARAGTPLMLAAPGLALDLPLRILVRADHDGAAVVSYRTPASLVAHAGLAPDYVGPLQAVADIAAIAANRR